MFSRPIIQTSDANVSLIRGKQSVPVPAGAVRSKRELSSLSFRRSDGVFHALAPVLPPTNPETFFSALSRISNRGCSVALSASLPARLTRTVRLTGSLEPAGVLVQFPRHKGRIILQRSVLSDSCRLESAVREERGRREAGRKHTSMGALFDTSVPMDAGSDGGDACVRG